VAQSEWTVDTLKEYVDKLREADQLATTTALTSAERAVAAALSAAEKATTKAENAADDRFKATNEFRQQLSDQTNTFIPRTESDVKLGALADRVTVLTERMDLRQGNDVGVHETKSDHRLDMNTLIAWIVAAAAIVGLVIKVSGG
jgi:dsDNA-specific endonuclease/ATPase MutS2